MFVGRSARGAITDYWVNFPTRLCLFLRGLAVSNDSVLRNDRLAHRLMSCLTVEITSRPAPPVGP